MFIIGVLGVFWTQAGNTFAIKTIVIDAGHGGKDPGAIGPGKTNEKDVALAVALKLGEEIHKNFPDINIIYTRKTDVFVELHERADIANKNKADLFICIHCNSSPVPSTYGTSTYVLGLHRTEANLEVAKRENSVILLEGDRDKNYEFDPNSPEGNIIMSMKQNAFLDQSIDFASKIEAQFENTAKRKSLGVKQAGFYVLYKTAMPSLLSEIGFVSNVEEEKFLKSTKGQETIAGALLKAFTDYKFEMENGRGEHAADIAANGPKGTGATDSIKTSKEPASSVSILTNPANAENTADVTPPAGEMTTQSGKVIRKPFENASGGGTAETTASNEKAPAIASAANATQSDNNQPTVATPATAPAETAQQPEKPTDDVIVKPGEKLEVIDPAPKETTPTEPPAEIKEEPKASPPVVKETAPQVKEPVVLKNEPPTPKPEVKTPLPAPKPKAPEAAATPVKTPPPAKTTGNTGATVYKVQLFALKGEPKKIETDKTDHLFGALTTEALPNGIIRYYAGEANNLESIHATLSKAQSNGYKDAFVVGFKNGQRFLPEKPTP